MMTANTRPEPSKSVWQVSKPVLSAVRLTLPRHGLIGEQALLHQRLAQPLETNMATGSNVNALTPRDYKGLGNAIGQVRSQVEGQTITTIGWQQLERGLARVTLLLDNDVCLYFEVPADYNSVQVGPLGDWGGI